MRLLLLMRTGSPREGICGDSDEEANEQETVWPWSYIIIFSGINPLGIYTPAIIYFGL